MNEKQWKKVSDQATKWIKEAGKMIMQSFSDELTVKCKSNPTDLVTNIDHHIEQFFVNKIKRTYPDHRILGEEGYGDKIDTEKGVLWIVDPIDGTTNFIHQKRHFAISIAVYEDGIGKIGLVYDVVGDELYHCIAGQGAFINGQRLPLLKNRPISQSIIALNATWITANRRIDPSVLSPLVTASRGTRSYGAAAIEIAYVAAGRLDAYLSMRLSPWDFAAAMLLIREVGGIMTRVDGEPIDLLDKNSVFVANPYLHQEILNQYILPGIQK